MKEGEQDKVIKRYPKGEKVKKCWKCEKPLAYGSVDYYHGMHQGVCKFEE